jgi:methionyl-tRNA formyltransferase
VDRPLRLTIFTQDERLFLPIPIARVAERFRDRITCLVTAPPLSTHGGGLQAVGKHLGVFGLRGSAAMATRLAATRAGLRLPGRRDRSVAEVGRRLGLPTFEVERVNSRAMARILDAHPADLLISVSCPQVVRARILGRFPLGGINVHSAPLPHYRGLLPSFWVLYHREPQTAVTVHDLGAGIDDGAILIQRPVPVAPDETWSSLVLKTKTAAGDALIEAIERIEDGTVERRPNDLEAGSYFSFPTWREGLRFRMQGGRMW